jgi:hypothetical protein
MSVPDRVALEASQQRWAEAQAARPPAREDERRHEDEIWIAHQSSTIPNTPASGG